MPPRDPEPEPPAEDIKWHQIKIAGMQAWGWVLILGFLFVFVSASILFPEEPEADDGDRYSAHAVCADFTRDRLKSPGSADFPEYNDRGVTIRSVGRRYTVTSFVDSDNSFGASLRLQFTCIVTYNGDSSWNLNNWVER